MNALQRWRLPGLSEIRAEIEKRKIAHQGPPPPTEIEILRQKYRSFPEFVKAAWHVIEPGRALIWNWHMDAVCIHLEAITYGRFEEHGYLPRLIINIPPGFSKSTMMLMWNAWEWTLDVQHQSTRFLVTSYEMTPVLRDNRKVRKLVTSDWYKALWPDIALVRSAEGGFENTQTGWREGSPFASLTSKRGDRLAIDDPHSVSGAESPVERAKAIRDFQEGGFNRLNDQVTSAIVVIMQRIHEDDLTGFLLREIGGFVHLFLPMEFEAERRCVTPFFTDPRTEDGELLDPARFPPAAITELKKMGAYAWAGQYQQRPSPREGGMFKRSYFVDRIIDAAPPGTVWWRHWDLAATSRRTNPQAARSAGVKMGRAPDGRIIVGHVITEQQEGAELRKIIKATAQSDTTDVKISLPQDPGQAGKVQAQDLVVFLVGFTVRAIPESGDKVTRAEPFATQCEALNVYLVRGIWNAPYVDELCMFPAGHWKDQVDASSGAFARLVGKAAVIVSPIVVSGALPTTGGTSLEQAKLNPAEGGSP